MLKSFTLENFRSYSSATLPLSPLTMLVGANASGKSNVIEALRLLSWLSSGNKLSSVQQWVQSSDRIIRGRLEDLPHLDSSTFKFGCQMENVDWTDFQIELSVTDGEPRVIYEELGKPDAGFPLYRVESAASGLSHDLEVAYNNFARGGIKPRVRCSDQQAIFTQLDTPARFGKTHEAAQRTIPEVCRIYQERLGQILFLDPVPSRMRDYAFENERSLFRDGSNISSVLYNLCKADGNKRTILEFIESLPEQDIRELNFITTQRHEVMVQLVETFGGKEKMFDAPILSDGTLRVLGVVGALLSAPTGGLVVVEEIDNGVHPTRASHLLKKIQEIATSRDLRVLFTTHNPALLNELPRSALKDVVFCYRDTSTGASRLVRLDDLEDYPSLVARGPLGELLAAGTLESFVKYRSDRQQRKSNAYEWISNLPGTDE